MVARLSSIKTDIVCFPKKALHLIFNDDGANKDKQRGNAAGA